MSAENLPSYLRTFVDLENQHSDYIQRGIGGKGVKVHRGWWSLQRPPSSDSPYLTVGEGNLALRSLISNVLT
jgi:hypothetical protein